MATKRKLTARQAEVLGVIKDHIKDSGFPPTRAEIAAKLGFKSPNAAEEHVKALDRKGAIKVTPGASRGIRISDEFADKKRRRRKKAVEPTLQKVASVDTGMGDLFEHGLPIVGHVAAGQPVLALENIEDYCGMAPDVFRPRADYLLRVRGDSMIDIGILDGDLLAVHKIAEAQNGQIVVARIEDEVTVKRFQRTDDPAIVHLLPENSAFEPIVVDLRSQELTIEGRSVGVIRRG